MNKKILVVSQRFWPEEQKITDICEGFVAEGYEVDVICGKPNYPAGKYFPGYSALRPKKQTRGGMELKRVWEIAREGGTHINILMNYTSFSIGSFLKALTLKKKKYDAVLVYQCSSLGACRTGLKLGRRFGIPVTYYVVDVWPQHFYKEMDIRNSLLRGIYKKRADKFYRNADHLIARSNEVAEYLTKNLDLPAGRVKTLPLCPERVLEDETLDHNILERYAGSFNVLLSGNIEKDRDLDSVIDAARRFYSSGIYDIRFIIVGTGSYLDELKKKVDKYDLYDLVYFEENVKRRNLHRYNFVADVLVGTRLPGEHEEFPSGTEVTDLMVSGRPVIATSGSFGALEVRKAGCGYSVEPGNPDEMYETIMRLYRMPKEQLEELGENAREYWDKHYNRLDLIRNILDVMYDRAEETGEDDGSGSRHGIIKFDADM